MKIHTQIKKKSLRRTYTIELPELFDELDFDKLALEMPPHIPIRERIRVIFNEIYRYHQKKNELDLQVFKGKKSEIQMEIFKSDKHILLAKGQEWYCPCVIGADCIMKE
ncbi:MAG: hypothetical protein QXV73_04550 [Candidatus Micrarchaeia archaeon]